MRSALIFLCLIAVFVVVLAACSKPSAPSGPPGISTMAIGKNVDATPPADSFNVDELIYVLAKPVNTNGKYNLNFQVSTNSEINQKPRGEHIMNKSVDFEGEQPQFLHFSIAYPGQYKIDAILSDAGGKQIDIKSGIITVTGESAPLESERDKDARDQDKDRDRDRKKN